MTPTTALVFEARGHVRLPDRYRSEVGQLLRARRSASVTFGRPGEPLLVEGEEVPVLVRTRAGLSRHVQATHPFDVVGWDGCLYPYALSIHDFEPIVGSHPPATARAPDLRRAQLRRVQLRAAPLRLRPERGEGAVPPRQRRLRRGAVLRRRRLHEPSRLGHRRRARSACTRPASSTARSRAASSARSTRSARASWRSCSTRSARSCWATTPWPSATPPTRGAGTARQCDPSALGELGADLAGGLQQRGDEAWLAAPSSRRGRRGSRR